MAGTSHPINVLLIIDSQGDWNLLGVYDKLVVSPRAWWWLAVH